MVQKCLFIIASLAFLSCTAFHPCHSMDDLPDEVYVNVFISLNLNQRDIPAVAGVSKRWEIIMNDKHIWKVYAGRAGVLAKGMQLNDYREGVKYYCAPSFEDLNGAAFQRMTINDLSPHVSYDGLVCAHSFHKNPNALKIDRNLRAIRWTPEDGVEFLGGGNEKGYSRVHGMSLDGSVIVGSAKYSSDQIQFDDSGWVIEEDEKPLEGKWKACYWKRKTGTIFLDVLDEWVESEAHFVTFDGSVIIGKGSTTQKQEVLFRQIRGKNIEILGNLNGGNYIQPKSVNVDGSVIVGDARDGAKQNKWGGFKWTLENGIESLEDVDTMAVALNFDSSVLVGHDSDDLGFPTEPFRWTPKDDKQYIAPLLNKFYMPENWKLAKVTLIASNGIVVYGRGDKKVRREDGRFETLRSTFRAVIPRGNLF